MNKKQHLGSVTQRAKIQESLVTTTLGAVASLVGAIATTANLLADSMKWTGTLAAALAASVGAVALSVGFTSMLARRERGSAQVARLKDELAGAYLNALESSSLNPFPKGSR